MTYWQRRATAYNNLNWVRSKQFMDAIIAAGNFQASDAVLDAGTGTGAVAAAIAPLVKRVVAIDASPHMLCLVPDGHLNIEWIVGDIRNLRFADGTFDKVTARYVFHHILDGVEKAMAECYRVLRRDGVMVFAEGVPPSERTKQDFIDIFRLKEERITFMPDDMETLMTSSGFTIATSESVWLEQMSVRNWVESGGLPGDTQRKLMAMHRNAPRYFKDDYHMTETDDDCLIDIKIEIVVGTKR